MSSHQNTFKQKVLFLNTGGSFKATIFVPREHFFYFDKFRKHGLQREANCHRKKGGEASHGRSSYSKIYT